MKYYLNKLADRILLEIEWLMPKTLVTWCFIRVFANATNGRYGKTECVELTAVEALERWTK